MQNLHYFLHVPGCYACLGCYDMPMLLICCRSHSIISGAEIYIRSYKQF